MNCAMVLQLTHFGYIKRQPTSVYRAQRRGGKGVVLLLQLELGAVFFTQNKAGEQNQRGRRDPQQIQPHAELQYALFFQLFIISKTRSRARK